MYERVKSILSSSKGMQVLEWKGRTILTMGGNILSSSKRMQVLEWKDRITQAMENSGFIILKPIKISTLINTRKFLMVGN